MMQSQTDLSSRRSKLFLFLTIGLGLIVTLAIAEILVRVLYRYNTPDTVRKNSLQYVPTLFARHALKPNQYVDLDSAWGLRADDDRTDRFYVVNEHGYRGRSFALQKPRGTCRTVVLGGSAVFDIMASEGRDWPHLVESFLKKRGFKNITVINAGIPGHASFDSLGRLYSQIWMLEPDYVFLYNSWNDIKYFRSISREQPLSFLFKPYDEKEDPFRSYRGGLDRFLSGSQLYVKLRNRYYLRKIGFGTEGRRSTDKGFSPSYNGLAVQQYRLNLQLFVDASQNIGAIPILMTQMSLTSSDAREDDRRRIAYEYQGLTHEALVRALAECNHTMLSVANEKGTHVIDLAAMFSGQSELFHDHVHTTAKGSEIIASAVAEFLSERLEEGCGDSPLE